MLRKIEFPGNVTSCQCVENLVLPQRNIAVDHLLFSLPLKYPVKVLLFMCQPRFHTSLHNNYVFYRQATLQTIDETPVNFERWMEIIQVQTEITFLKFIICML